MILSKERLLKEKQNSGYRQEIIEKVTRTHGVKHAKKPKKTCGWKNGLALSQRIRKSGKY